GKEVTWIPSYGPEMRGGTAHCFVVISDEPIGAPVVAHPKIAVVFNKPSFLKYEPLVAAGGALIVNSSLVAEVPSRTDLTTLRVPATEIAERLGNPRMTNMVLLGALLGIRDLVSYDVLHTSLAEHIPAHHRNLLDLNYQALSEGYGVAESRVIAG
ncbi:MAG: 2-oxoacid:acceptor oxidoreductase family protein, partial [Anaerolineae bacterium]|nr:2-oxoacid:acceptor oxidoreductase family protein [Anaerolineae bacterium]